MSEPVLTGPVMSGPAAGGRTLATPAPNTMSRPYRGLSVQETDVPLTPSAITEHLVGREVYRRTDYLVLRNGPDLAVAQVRKESDEELFVPVAECVVMAGPGQTLWIDAPDTDVGNATDLARTALAHARDGVLAYVVRGRFEHVNFIWKPTPLTVRVSEVVPPDPPKLFAMAQQAAAFDEDLPPIDLRLDAVDIVREAADHPSDVYLLPCRGSGVDLPAPVAFLDTRPAERREWLLIGCERSAQFHRHFYGDEPPRVDICPRRLPTSAGELRLTKCCLLERGVEYEEGTAVVPWGANLDEVRDALRWLAGWRDDATTTSPRGR
ncbi:DUF7714 family protein [Actinacidiphila yeochonensis]|uniref:DUF7714 family protein n=1 Tax=Actinacidiphila yeochonensis TaxID=89050 RepID=UPI000A493F20|nr:hypothetical protein [Actinacidiphila yeochonensis]